MPEETHQRIIDLLQAAACERIIADVRIGLGYTCVRLDNDDVGLAWTAKERSASCTQRAEAGTLSGRPAVELLKMLVEPDALSRTIGLATANALASGFAAPETTTENVLNILNIQTIDRVVMVGYFDPLVPRIQQTGCRLDILELDSSRPGTLSPEEGDEALAACSVAIITATSIVTGTLDQLLSKLDHPRAAVILGPSTFMRPEVYAGTALTHVAGSRVCDASAVERIVSEGGGTRILKPHLSFETIVLDG